MLKTQLTLCILFLISYFFMNATIANAQSGSLNTIVNSLSTSSNSIFFKIPSNEQLNELVVQADSGGIVQIVQTLSQNTKLQCDHTLAYFLQLRGKIHTILLEKRTQYVKIQLSQQLSEEEIARINKQIKNLNGWQSVLQLSSKKIQLMEKLDNLTKLYNLYNSAEIQREPEERKIQGYNDEIAMIIEKNDLQRQRIEQEQLRLVQIEQNVERLEQILQQEKQKRQKSKQKIALITQTVNNNEIKIKTIKNIIANIERGILTIQNRSTDIRRSYSFIQIEAQRLRSQIQQLQKKQDELSSTIKNLEQRIIQEQRNDQSYKLEEIQIAVKSLQAIIPGINEQIQNQFEKCYSTNSKMKVLKINGQILYIMKYVGFVEYIKNMYGNHTFDIPEKMAIIFGKVNIFSKPWIEKYDNSVNTFNQFAQNKRINNQHTCLDLKNLTYGHGLILTIDNNKLLVRDLQKNIRFYLIIVPCTGIESSVKQLHTGQRIIWKGTLIKGLLNQVQLYWASAF